MESALKLIETKDVEQKSLTIIEQATAVKVHDPETYQIAGATWKALGDMLKEIDSAFDENIAIWHKGHKNAVAKKKLYYEPVDNARRLVKSIMSDYDREQERKKLAEEARLREIARKEEEERKLAEALAAEAAGEKEEAEAIMEEPVYVPPVVVKKEVPKVQGLSFRTVWKFHVKDVTAIPRQYMAPDMVKIGGVVRAMKGQTNIPGVEVHEERV